MPRNCPIISHLSFADDVIIFTNGTRPSLKKLMSFLGSYKKESGHLINKSKSYFFIGNSASLARASSVATCTGFIQKSFPIKYL